ncbi:MAG: hypothetical protein ACR2FY_10650 [Pirellulaceae bacterium]
MAKFRRRIFLVDSKVQGALMVRVAAYWVYCLFTITLMLVWWDMFAGPPRPFMLVLGDVYQRFAPGAAASFLILPLVVMDVLRLSNRFAGPARRLKNALCELGEGKETRPLLFRDNDFWQETAAEFNRVNDRIKQLSARQARYQADADPIDAVAVEGPVLAGPTE